MKRKRIKGGTANDTGLVGGQESEEPVWSAGVTQRIDELLRLPTNWDSYGASPINPSAAAAALRLVLRTADSATPAPQVVPTVEGGLQLEWHERGIDLEIATHPGGRVTLYYFDHRTGKESEDDLGPDLSRLRAALDELARRG